MPKRKEVQLNSAILSGKYSLRVETKIEYFNGDGLKDEDMPGWFMKQFVYLTGSSKRDEELIKQMGKRLPILLTQIPPNPSSKEITSEPLGYEDLKHKDLVRQVITNPRDYIKPGRLIDLLKET